MSIEDDRRKERQLAGLRSQLEKLESARRQSWVYPVSGSNEIRSIRMIVRQTSHGFSVGKLVQFNAASSLWVVLTSGSSGFGGVAIVSKIFGSDNFEIVEQGYIETLSGLTPGANYYDDGSGSLSSSAVNSAHSPILLRAISATEGIFSQFAGTLGGLEDVVITSPADGDTLQYVLADQAWENKPPAAASGSVTVNINTTDTTNAAALTESGPFSAQVWTLYEKRPRFNAQWILGYPVSISSPSTGQALVYNGTSWQNSTIVSSGTISLTSDASDTTNAAAITLSGTFAAQSWTLYEKRPRYNAAFIQNKDINSSLNALSGTSRSDLVLWWQKSASKWNAFQLWNSSAVTGWVNVYDSTATDDNAQTTGIMAGTKQSVFGRAGTSDGLPSSIQATTDGAILGRDPSDHVVKFATPRVFGIIATQYNTAVFKSSGSGSWSAPADGRYRFLVWGGGGQGSGVTFAGANTLYLAASSGGATTATIAQALYGGGGGGAGALTVVEVDLTSGQTVSYVVGSGGSGAATNSDGNAGTASTITISGCTVTSGGGGGGGGVTGGIGGTGGAWSISASLPSGATCVGFSGQNGERAAVQMLMNGASAFTPGVAHGANGSGIGFSSTTFLTAGSGGAGTVGGTGTAGSSGLIAILYST